MPFYNTEAAGLSNSVAGTEWANATMRTGSQAARICQCLFNPENRLTVGAMRLRIAAFATPSTGGAAPAGDPFDNNNPASTTIGLIGSPIATPGSGTRTTHLSIGADQLGPSGGVWAARNRSAAITLNPNAGANGNADVLMISTTASVNWKGNVIYEE